MTRSRATADTQDNNGGSVAPFVAGKNRILNSDFSIWQRGTTFSNPASDTGFTADRFYSVHNGTGATRTISRQAFTPGTAPVAGYEGQFFLRYDLSVAGSGNTYNYLTTSLEDVRTLAGQVVTFSFWAKASTTTSVLMQIDQFFGSGGSAVNYNALATSGTATVTTSWQRFTHTSTLASVSGRTIGTGSYLRLFISMPAFGGTPQVDFWGLQLEAGSVATPFTTATGNPASELAACQRYYWRVTGQFGYVATGTAANTTDVLFQMALPVQMRVAPTSVGVSAIADWLLVPGNRSISAITLTAPKPSIGSFFATSTGLSANQSWTLFPNGGTSGANTFIDFSAEL